MSNTPIIAFSKDWNDVPTCATHILRTHARTHPVLWLSSIGTRTPSLAAGKDWRRIMQKLSRLGQRAEPVENNLRVLSPVVIPKAETALARAINRRLLRYYARRETWLKTNTNTEVWSFVPNAGDYVDCFDNGKVIYYCVDDWSLFSHLDQTWIERCERRLIERADLVFVTSRFLEEKWRTAAAGKLHYLPHGVDFAKFARVTSTALAPLPPDLSAIPEPRIGFYGNIRSWIDFELVEKLAARHTAWSWVLIGPVDCDISRFDSLANVHFIGRREHDALPDYCAGFDVAFIPYQRQNPRMISVNPVKLRELLAAGVPVVSVDIPETRGISDYVKTATTIDEFSQAISEFLALGNAQSDLRCRISNEREGDDWTARVRDIRAIIDASSVE